MIIIMKTRIRIKSRWRSVGVLVEPLTSIPVLVIPIIKNFITIIIQLLSPSSSELLSPSSIVIITIFVKISWCVVQCLAPYQHSSAGHRHHQLRVIIFLRLLCIITITIKIKIKIRWCLVQPLTNIPVPFGIRQRRPPVIGHLSSRCKRI